MVMDSVASSSHSADSIIEVSSKALLIPGSTMKPWMVLCTDGPVPSPSEIAIADDAQVPDCPLNKLTLVCNALATTPWNRAGLQFVGGFCLVKQTARNSKPSSSGSYDRSQTSLCIIVHLQ